MMDYTYNSGSIDPLSRNMNCLWNPARYCNRCCVLWYLKPGSVLNENTRLNNIERKPILLFPDRWRSHGISNLCEKLCKFNFESRRHLLSQIRSGRNEPCSLPATSWTRDGYDSMDDIQHRRRPKLGPERNWVERIRLQKSKSGKHTDEKSST